MELSTNSVAPPETERDCRKDERHKDGNIDQQYGTSYITNNEFVTQMEVSANSAEFPEVKMDFKFILWTLKSSCIFISTQWKYRPHKVKHQPTRQCLWKKLQIITSLIIPLQSYMSTFGEKDE